MSSKTTSPRSIGSCRAVRRNSPSDMGMIPALWPSVIVRRRFAFAYSKANRTIQRVPATESASRDAGVGPDLEAGQPPELLPEPFGVGRPGRVLRAPVEVLGVLPDRRGPPARARVSTPGSDRAGRTAANKSSSWRRATFTLRKPVPTGVVIGPLIATRAARIASRVASGRRSPCSAAPPIPPGARSSRSRAPRDRRRAGRRRPPRGVRRPGSA